MNLKVCPPLKVYSPLLLFTCLLVAESLHYYKTPALSNQFSKFEITTSIPSDGKGGFKPKQAALKFSFTKYNRRYITFNFKGKGNAQLQFFNSDRSKQFKVIIGGGTLYNKVYVVSSKGKLYSATVNGITSEQEYRSFWIRAKWGNSQNKYSVFVGLCSDPRENRILHTSRINENFKPKIYHIRLSTARGSSGQWQFASAGQKLGGCGDGISCSDNEAPQCDQRDKDWDRDKTGLIGTCIPKSVDFSLLVFGSGECQKVCGTGNEVCGAGETCKNNKCLASTTMSTKTAGTTTISNKTKAITHMTTQTPYTTTAIMTTFLSTSVTSPTFNTNTFQTSTTITQTVADTTIIAQTIASNRNTTTTATLPSAPTITHITASTLHTTIIATTNPSYASAAPNRISTLPTTTKATTFLSSITPATTLTATSNMTETFPISTTTTATNRPTRPTTVTTIVTLTKSTNCLTAAFTDVIQTLSTAKSLTKVTITNPLCHMVDTITTTMPTTASTPTIATTTHALTFTETTTATESTSATATNSHKSTYSTSTYISVSIPTLALSTRTSISSTSSTTTKSVTKYTTTVTATDLTPTKATYATTIGQSTTASTSTPTTRIVTTVAAFHTASLLSREIATEENSSFSLGFDWAIIAGAGGGLATVVAIACLLWNRAACFRRYLCLSRRVTPAKSSKPDNDEGGDTFPLK